MDKDRISGSAKEFAGKAEGAVGDIAGDAETQGSLQPDYEPTRLTGDFFEVKEGERLAGRKAQSPEKTSQRQPDRRLDVMRWPELLMHRAERQVWEQRRQCREVCRRFGRAKNSALR